MKTNSLMLALVCLLTGLLIGTYAEKSVSATNPENSNIKANSIQLIDAEGRTRIVIAAGNGPKVSPGLYLMDSQGKNRVVLTQAKNGDSVIGLYRPGTKALFGISVPAGGPGFTIEDNNGTTRATLGIVNGSSVLQLLNANGQQTVLLPR